MATSEQLAFVRGSLTSLGDFAGDTAQIADAINNLLHNADECSRVIVNVADCSLNYVKWSGSNTGQWKPVFSSGVFYPLLRDDGSIYPIRVRIGGAAGSATGSVFRIGVCPLGTAPVHMSGATILPNVVQTATITSTTPAWLTTLLSTLVTLDAGQVGAALTEIATYDAVSSATPVGVLVCPCTIEVWTKDLAPDDATPTVSGVYAAEYCGV